MSIGTLTPRGRRITVDFDHALADRIAEMASQGSTPQRKLTASDIIREAVAAFVLPSDGTNGSHMSTKTTERNSQAGKRNG